MTKTEINIVWLKKDLRCTDHLPFYTAVEADKPFIAIFIFEPTVISAPDSSPRHWRFALQGLHEMKSDPQAGRSIHFFYEEAIDVFQKLSDIYKIDHVYSHEETGNLITFKRDIQLKNFFKENEISWKEYRTNAVVRGLKSRDNWSEMWEAHMNEPIKKISWYKAKFEILESNQNTPREVLKLIENDQGSFQVGGSSFAWKYFNSFLEKRCLGYRRNISKPEASRKGCSRISPYLTWGNISIREAVQATHNSYSKSPYKRDLSFFIARLHWHCHFIQKLESEYTIETTNLNPGFNAIRTIENPEIVNAWKQGKTGIPMIDACMRCVVETGYINFRMRSMLVSFLTHHLQQPWQSGTHHLAKAFLDYEPGIHYPQFQMQAGTMGVNTIRIYNPVKQGKDHDPNGDFIKKWLPELANLPTPFVHEPWEMTAFEEETHDFHLGKNYPYPIVNLEDSAKKARELIWSVKRSAEVKANNSEILKKHTKRKSENERPIFPKLPQ
ncbi:MAG: deoxyribodipyrimidine photo-lyase [Flavobacteriales bacterium]